jgi:hypothetical protein
MSIVIVNPYLKGHKIICIMVSLNIYIIDRYNIVKHLLLNKIIFIEYVKSKENIVDLLTKCLLKELVYNSLRGISLKPVKDERVY